MIFWNNIPNSFYFLLRDPFSFNEIPSLYIRKIWNNHVYACTYLFGWDVDRYVYVLKLGFGEEGFYHFSLGGMGFCWVNDFLNCGMYFFELLVLISEGHWIEREFVGWTQLSVLFCWGSNVVCKDLSTLLFYTCLAW